MSSGALPCLAPAARALRRLCPCLAAAACVLACAVLALARAAALLLKLCLVCPPPPWAAGCRWTLPRSRML